VCNNITKEQAMKVNPYLMYNGNCEAAFKFYEKVLGGKIEMMLTHEGAPESMPTPPEWKKKIMHARMSIDGEVIMASDAPPGHFHKPQGFSVSLQVQDPAEAERKFKALSEGGNVNMAFGKTFFSRGFGMCVDQFGIPWMVNSPMEG
jgi:PhnB protein